MTNAFCGAVQASPHIAPRAANIAPNRPPRPSHKKGLMVKMRVAEMAADSFVDLIRE